MLAACKRVFINDALRRRAGHDVFLRTFEMRWPFDDQDYPQVVERLVQSGMSLAEAQRAVLRQLVENLGELPLGAT
jgi:hypothetical protein